MIFRQGGFHDAPEGRRFFGFGRVMPHRLAKAAQGLCISRSMSARCDGLYGGIFDRGLSEDAAHFHIVGEDQAAIADASWSGHR